MAKKDDNFQKEILEIKSKLCDMHTDLKRFFEQSDLQHHESVLSGIQKDFSNVIIGHVTEDINDVLTGIWYEIAKCGIPVNLFSQDSFRTIRA